MAVKLYGRRLSPYYERIILQAKLKGLGEEAIETPGIPGDDMKSEAYLAISPLGKIPAIDDDGFMLPESGIVAEYLEEKFPETPLLPSDAQGRARARLIVRLFDLYVIDQMFRTYFSMASGSPDQALIDDAKATIAKGLDAIERYVEGGAYLVGDGWTLADCAAIPAAFYLPQILPAAGLDPWQGRPKLAAWYAAVSETDLAKGSHAAMAAALEAFRAAQAN